MYYFYKQEKKGTAYEQQLYEYRSESRREQKSLRRIADRPERRTGKGREPRRAHRTCTRQEIEPDHRLAPGSTFLPLDFRLHRNPRRPRHVRVIGEFAKLKRSCRGTTFFFVFGGDGANCNFFCVFYLLLCYY